ncbi:MAG: CheB methylesterase domain-containing protein [Deltaproteobacteria bacterium]
MEEQLSLLLRPAAFGRNSKDISLRIIALGASTGGVEALQTVLAGLPAHCPPTLVVQHMKPDFLPRFPARLAEGCKARVVSAEDGMVLQSGHIYVAAHLDCHLTVELRRQPVCRILPGPPVSGHRPSVDQLFQSLAEIGSRVSAALLTGMGRDGAAGLLAIRKAGGMTIAQNEATCVVYGMPRVAVEMGAAIYELALPRIAALLLNSHSRPRTGTSAL